MRPIEMVAFRTNPRRFVAKSDGAARTEGGRTPRELRHDLGNALGALRLRVQLLLADPACRAAQSRNLEAIERILNRSIDLFAKLHTRTATEARGPMSKRRKRRRTAKR